MIIKLATFTKEEEDKIRKNLSSPSAVKSKAQMLNYAHPATILGGATGGFIGSEVGDKLFGGSHGIHEIIKAKPRSFVKRVFGKKESVIQKLTPGSGLLARYGKNLFRGSMGALGAGIGAYGVMKYRQNKDEKK